MGKSRRLPLDKSRGEKKILDYDGIILRSRFAIDKDFLDSAPRLQFIGRVGAGLENIDTDYARQKGISLLAVPGGNSNAVGEHTLGLLLALFNNLPKADREVKSGKWLREENRGVELDGKIVGIIGYGNTGKAFAKKLRGFDVEVLCYDILKGVGDSCGKQVSLSAMKERAQVLSLHVPQTSRTTHMVDSDFINEFRHPFWLLNTSRGKVVSTDDLVTALKSGKILGAALDVLEYEQSSFERLFLEKEAFPAFDYLKEAPHVILSPHIAGWTLESKEKLAQRMVTKIKERFFNSPEKCKSP